MQTKSQHGERMSLYVSDLRKACQIISVGLGRVSFPYQCCPWQIDDATVKGHIKDYIGRTNWTSQGKKKCIQTWESRNGEGEGNRYNKSISSEILKDLILRRDKSPIWFNGKDKCEFSNRMHQYALGGIRFSTLNLRSLIDNGVY